MALSGLVAGVPVRVTRADVSRPVRAGVMHMAVEFARTVLVHRTDDSCLASLDFGRKEGHVLPSVDERRSRRGLARRIVSPPKCRDNVPPRRPTTPARHLALLVMAGLVATAGALIANWAVARFGVSSNVAGSVAFCAAWIALYPWMRLNRTAPSWRHWIRGACILVVLWLVILLSR